MENEETKISEKDFIKLGFLSDNIEVTIKYPKRSQLKKRFEILDKFKEFVRKA